MNSGRFFIPRMGVNLGPMMSTGYLPTRSGMGIFGRITSSLRSFNWSGLLNGANKTLNVVNQTIPLVRQAGPMFSNMKSMLRLAKVFGSETGNKMSKKSNLNYENSKEIIKNNKNINIVNNTSNNIIKSDINYSYPNFFI